MSQDVLEGQIKTLVSDYFNTKHSEKILFLKQQDSFQNIKFDTLSNVNPSSLNSQHVTLRGYQNLEHFEVQDMDVQNALGFIQNSQAIAVRSLIVARISFTGDLNRDADESKEDIEDHLERSNAVFQQGTWGQVQFDYDKNKDGQADIYDISIAYNPMLCDSLQPSFEYIAPAAKRAMKNQHGIDIADYHHFLMKTPDMPECADLGGFAELGSLQETEVLYSVALQQFSQTGHTFVIAHELGHNLGLYHAEGVEMDSQCNPGLHLEYGDYSSIMSNGDGNQHETLSLNAIEAEQLLAFAGHENKIGIVNSGVYTVYPLRMNPQEANGPQVLSILRPSGRHAYISYRNNLNLDQNLNDCFANKVHFHETTYDAGSNFKALLSNGDTYTDDQNIKIKVLNIADNEAYAQIEVIVDDVGIENKANIEPIADGQTALIANYETQTNVSLNYLDYNYGPGPFSFEIVEQAQKGHFVFNSASVLQRYKAPDNFIGTDQFKWKMNDGRDDSNIVTSQIKVLPPGEASDKFDAAQLDTSIVSAGVVKFTLNYSNEHDMQHCEYKFGDYSFRELCKNNFEHKYADGEYEACALMTDKESKVMIACSQFEIKNSPYKQKSNLVQSRLKKGLSCHSNDTTSFFIMFVLSLFTCLFYFKYQTLKQ